MKEEYAAEEWGGVGLKKCRTPEKEEGKRDLQCLKMEFIGLRW